MIEQIYLVPVALLVGIREEVKMGSIDKMLVKFRHDMDVLDRLMRYAILREQIALTS